MADNNPNFPGGSPPPRPSDSKVLPKKETVRINLPPKPSAAPTIKLPTLPPGGPAAMSSAPAAPAPRATAAPATSAPAQRQTPASRPQPSRQAAAAQTVSGLDKALAIAAAIVVLIAVGTTYYCMTLFVPSP